MATVPWLAAYWPVIAALGGAISPNDMAIAQEARPAAAVLSMAHARSRAARVSDVAYNLRFQLDGEGAHYVGTVQIHFALSSVEEDLTLDFAGGAVASVTINGESIDVDYNGYFLTAPAAALQLGDNTIEIEFSRPYSTDGNGLYRFRDPEDGRYYLYTDFEPYHQNRLFPSFDQPDLKARYSTEVTVPADWVVVSIVAESGVSRDGERSTWSFPASPPISTYIYALHAGEYQSWRAQAGDIPLRLFARQSLARYVQPEDWFTFTRQGFEFFQDYFEIDYPFGKYDQLIVPHFNAGAMENVGAVTFNERYVHRGAVTRQDRRALASVILHEMAHMWFGDLVTMDWWNGLWLNESFATFMSTLSMAEATEFSEAWQIAYQRTIGAYRADERDTTHAIELPVPDTDSAFANFDAITYNKGSATLTQLNHLVGPEVFRRGVSEYLSAHAYGNTGIDDFLGAISAAAGQDLQRWAAEWLHQPGANGVAVDLQCDGGAIAGLALVQSTPQAWPTYRTHRTQLGLYDFDGAQIAVRTLPVTYTGQRTAVDAAVGEPCPDLIYPNHGDWDYVRVQLDPGDLRTLSAQLGRFGDPLVRSMLWQGVWDMVLEARLTATDFVEFVRVNLPGEADDTVAEQAVDSLRTALSYLMRLDPAVSRFAEIGPAVEALLWQQAAGSPAGSDRQLQMFDHYVSVVSSAAGVERLAALLHDHEAIPSGMELDQDRRWAVLRGLSEAGYRDLDRLLAAERANDPSDQGRLQALAAEAAQPVFETKLAWINRLLDEGAQLSLADSRTVMGNLFPARQHELQARFTEQILGALAELSRNRDPSYLTPVARGLLRPLCTRAHLARLDTAIGESGTLHPVLARGLRDTRFETARCIAIGEKLAAAGDAASG